MNTIIKITPSRIIFLFTFGACLLFVLMRPVLTYYLTDTVKYIFMIGIISALCDGILSLFFRHLSGSDIAEYGLLIIFALYAIISSFSSGGKELLIMTIVRYLLYSFPIIAVPVLCKRINFNHLFTFLSIFGIIDSTISIYEFITHNVVFKVYDTMIVVQQNGALRTFGLNGNYFLLAEILSLCGLTSLYSYFQQKDKFFLIAFVWISLGVFSTGTRGYYVSYLLGMVVLYVGSKLEGGFTKSLFMKLLLGVVVFLFVFYFVAFSNITFGNAAIADVLTRFRSIFNWSTENANVMRARAWQNSILAWKQNLLLGHGACCTELDYSGRLLVTESGVLKRLVDLGLIGTILQYATMLFPLFCGFSIYRRSNNRNPLCIWALSIVVCSFVEDIILQMYTGIEFTIIIWFCIAVIYYFPDKYSFDKINPYATL